MRDPAARYMTVEKIVEDLRKAQSNPTDASIGLPEGEPKAKPIVLTGNNNDVDIKSFKLRATAINALNQTGIEKMSQLAQLTEDDILRHKFVGRKALREIERALEQHGLSLGMTEQQVRDSMSGTGALASQLLRLMRIFTDDMRENKPEAKNWNEAELTTSLISFIRVSDPSIILKQEVRLGDSHFRADVLAEKQGQQVLIEVKTQAYKPNQKHTAVDQLLAYLGAANISTGVLYIGPMNKGYWARVRMIPTGHSGRTIWMVAPYDYH
jgi:hypothetical protein